MSITFEPFTGPGSTPARRRFWDDAMRLAQASRKLPGINVKVDEYPSGSVISVPDSRAKGISCPSVVLSCDQICASCSKCGVREYASPFMAFYKTQAITLNAIYTQNTPITDILYSRRFEELSSTTTVTFTPDCPCPASSTECLGSFNFHSDLSDGSDYLSCSSSITGCSGFFAGCDTPFTTCNPPYDYWKHSGATHVTGNPLPYYTFSDPTCMPSLEIYDGCFESAPHCTIPGPLTATSGTTATYSVHRHVESDPVSDFLDVTWALTVTLSDEDTTDDLIARTVLPEYDGDYNDPCGASRDLADDESSYSICQFKPKFTIPSVLSSDLVICYNEHFVPDTGDPTDTAKTVTITAGTTSIVGDEILNPDTNGEITITDIKNSCANHDVCHQL